MSWLTIVNGIIQLIFLILSKAFDKTVEDRKRKDKLHEELKDAIDKKDTARITAILSGLR